MAAWSTVRPLQRPWATLSSTRWIKPRKPPSLFRDNTGARAFHRSTQRLQTAVNALSTGRPVGAFRGGIIGFLLGTSIGAYGSYYYLFDDYRRSNDILNEDMYALQVAVTRLTNYVTSLEAKINQVQKKR